MWVATALALVGSIVAPVQFARAEISGQPSFALPYAKDASWSMNGPHTNTGSGGGKRNSVDFAGGDGKVRAAASGTVKSTSCGVLIDHGGGWHTSYYHLTGITVSANQKVSVGDHIGNIGNAVPCGGYSTAAHVHFAVWKFSGTYSGSDAQAVAIDGLSIGGWTVRNGSGNYQGSWQRNSDGHVKQVRSDGLFSCDCLTNYGGGQPQPPAPTKIVAVLRSSWLEWASVSIMLPQAWRTATRFCSGSATLTRLISSGSTTTERCACTATTTCASMRRGVPRLERAAR